MKHATIDAYTNHGCRCQPCKDHWREYQRALVARRITNGICTHCSRPRDQASKRLCRAHIEQSRVRSKAFYNRHREVLLAKRRIRAEMRHVAA